MIEWERLEISSRKLETPREHFMQRRYNKGQKRYGPKISEDMLPGSLENSAVATGLEMVSFHSNPKERQ